MKLLKMERRRLLPSNDNSKMTNDQIRIEIDRNNSIIEQLKEVGNYLNPNSEKGKRDAQIIKELDSKNAKLHSQLK